jgi:UDP-N-acetylmuramoyl-tripeptide--D-alanyl-D-alanine ligase
MSAMMTLVQALNLIPGGRLIGDGSVSVARVHTDTRTLQADDLFVALKGERFDAHQFLSQAVAQGAVAAIAQHGLEAAGLAGIEVPDSKLALGALSAGWRAQFRLPVIAVAGSNGKTTVTQMIASILRAWLGDGALATQGNLNNDIGVPLTLLRLRDTHKAAVVELGMNHPGEIAHLARLTRPTVALVNNAQREHLEFMSTVEAVALENGAVLEALPASGVAVYPADDAYTSLWSRIAGARTRITFASAGVADVTLISAEWVSGAWQVTAQTPSGQFGFRLHVAGRHNVRNALAAAAGALAAGAPVDAIADGLSAFEPVNGRSRALALTIGGRTVTVIDDTYNANPDSVRAAIDVLSELAGPRLLVLGDMGEVGDRGPEFHAEVGAYARACGIEQMLTLGIQSVRAADSFPGARHFTEIEGLNAAVSKALPLTCSALVKGSRFMKMERVVQAMTAAAQPSEDVHGAHHA